MTACVKVVTQTIAAPQMWLCPPVFDLKRMESEDLAHHYKCVTPLQPNTETLRIRDEERDQKKGGQTCEGHGRESDGSWFYRGFAPARTLLNTTLLHLNTVNTSV